MRAKYLYLLDNLDHSLFKIGVTSHPLERFISIGNCDCRSVDLYEFCESAQETERILHKLFHNYQRALEKGSGRTEWYTATIKDQVKYHLQENRTCYGINGIYNQNYLNTSFFSLTGENAREARKQKTKQRIRNKVQKIINHNQLSLNMIKNAFTLRAWKEVIEQQDNEIAEVRLTAPSSHYLFVEHKNEILTTYFINYMLPTYNSIYHYSFSWISGNTQDNSCTIHFRINFMRDAKKEYSLAANERIECSDLYINDYAKPENYEDMLGLLRHI